MVTLGTLMQPVRLDGRTLTIDQVEAIARTNLPVELTESAWARIRLARAVVERAAARDDLVYGLSTGVGAFKRHGVPSAERAAFQERMIRTHAVGVGPALPTDQVRAIIAARLNGMAVGLSSAGPDLVEALLALLNRRVHPIVPALGSLGAADLAQNAAIGAVLLGFGEAEYEG
ncbi:MAG TPA: aromatic amino acid lyase, partial [Chloroflexota bacterium]|nr:aromatic amino acid lyase [Chloroflexota bacterium]